MKRGLMPKQSRFVEEYLIDLNATQAAIRAGYSKKNADKIGPKLVGGSRVSEAIRAAIEKRSEATGLTAEWVVERLKVEATKDGENASHSARVSALGLLAKHLGMLPNKHEVSGKDSVPLYKVLRGIIEADV